MRTLLMVLALVWDFSHFDTTAQTIRAPEMPPSSSIVELNLWTFRGSVGDGRLWFVQFYVPWCRGCKRMVGQFDELADAFRANREVVVARFDCMQDEDLCERLGVDRTPTLKLFLNGTAVETYKADFYHVDLMGPFLGRMLGKYKGQQSPQEHDGTGSGEARGKGPAADTIHATRVQPGAYDKGAGSSASTTAEEADAGSPDGGSDRGAAAVGGAASDDDSSEAVRGGAAQAGEVGVVRTEDRARAPVVPTSDKKQAAMDVDGEGMISPMAGAEVQEDPGSCGNSGAPEVLKRAGRNCVPVIDTLQREKEEL